MVCHRLSRWMADSWNSGGVDGEEEAAVSGGEATVAMSVAEARVVARRVVNFDFGASNGQLRGVLTDLLDALDREDGVIIGSRCVGCSREPDGLLCNRLVFHRPCGHGVCDDCGREGNCPCGKGRGPECP